MLAKKSIFICIYILLFQISPSKAVIDIKPEVFINNDMIFQNNNDNEYFYAAGYFTSNNIDPYLRNQGYTLAHDNSCTGTTISDFDGSANMNGKSDYTNIYSQAIYDTGGNTLTCDFPVKFFTNNNYQNIEYKIYLMSKGGGTANIEIGNKGTLCTSNIAANGAQLFTISLSPSQTGGQNTVDITCNPGNTIQGYTDISKIKFSMQGGNESPAIAMYTAKITIRAGATNNMSLEGTKICDSTNPCLPRFTCIGGQCLPCDPTCLYCDSERSRTGCIKMCSPHASSPSPTNGQCLMNYVDVSQFSIKVNNIDPPRTNRVTMGLWIFFSENIQVTVSIQLDDFIAMKFETGKLTCTFNELNKYQGQDGTENGNITPGQWIYGKCGMSTDHAKYFVELFNPNKIGGNEMPLQIPAPNKEFYRKFYREGDKTTIKFSGFNANNFPIYIRNLYLFREMLPSSYFDTRYYYIEKFIYSTRDVPELLFAIPFDNLIQEGSTFKTTAISFDTTQRSFQINITPRDNYHLNPSKNFKRLNLLEKSNIKYASKDLIQTTALTVGANQMFVYDDNLPFACSDTFYMRKDKSCNSNCDTGFSVTSGVSMSKGICNYDCVGTNAICQDQSYGLMHLKEEFKCNAGFFRMFYYCLPDNENEKTFMFYNENYSPGRIILDYTSYNLYSYFVEIWIYYQDKKNYLFYSNFAKLYVDNLGNFKAESPHGGNDIIPALETGRWSKLVFEVFYDEQRTNRDTIIKVYIHDGREIEIGATKNKVQLTKIYFCSSDPLCEGLNFKWSSALYKNLRVWNGNIASPSVAYRYLEYDSFIRLQSTIGYYPLYGKFIAKNELGEMDSQGNLASFVYESNTYNPWDLRKWNYGYEANIACGANCKQCYSNTKCYKCNDGFILDTNANCQTAQNYVLKIPSNIGIKFSVVGNLPALPADMTITMWVKLFGFGTGNEDMVYYSDNLKLKYIDDINSDNYGLNLMSVRATKEITLSVYKYYRKYIGKWAFISVSYYNFDTSTYFPEMIRFEVNDQYLPFIGTIDSGIKFDKISFNENMYALIYSVKVYSSYIVGAYSYQRNNPQIAPTITKLGSQNTKANCMFTFDDGTQKQYNCEPTHLPATPTFQCHNKCNQCYNTEETNCACFYNNADKKMFLGNKESHYCYQLDYVNFAKANVAVQCNGATFTGSGTGKATMHFWIYAYSYVPLVFEGVVLNWPNHVKIEIAKNFDKNGYEFECSIDTHSKKMTFEMNQWNFLHCSVDYPNKQFYMTTYDSSYVFGIATNTPPANMNGGASSFTFQDKTTVKDWGVLFFRQIRLWNQAFESSSFLSKVLIETRSKFSGLEYQWDPLYNANYLVQNVDIGYKNCNLKITPQATKIGSNIVSDKDYSLISFCNENGEYFDRKTQSCVKFTDIAKAAANTIEIKDVDISYNHNYGIAFWAMFEDETNLVHGFKVDWSYHMQIAIQYDNTVYTYCFPQNYPPYSEIIQDPAITLNDKYDSNKILNKKRYSVDNISGKWQWFQCMYSYYNRYFYINDDSAEIVTETIYDAVSNDAPIGYFFDNKQSMISTLTIDVTDKGKKIFLRSLYLFKDYLPKNYNFKYMDLFKTPDQAFPPLTLAINFANYILNGVTLTFDYNQYDWANKITNKKFDVQIQNANNLELSSNFVFLPLCDPETFEKYDENTKLCVEISNCDTNGLNALYCMEENTPLICKDNNFINIQTNGTITCEGACPNDKLRTPGTHVSQGICSSSCVSGEFLQICPNDAASILSYPTSFKCKNLYNPINYQCFDGYNSKNKGALFYSRCSNPANIYRTFSSDFRLKTVKGYSIEFWFMIDNVICPFTTFTQTDEFVYFYAYPHTIFWRDSKIFYKFINTNTEEDISPPLLHQYEWNKIVIMMDILLNQVTLYINFSETPIVIAATGALELKNIAFCTGQTDPKCTEQNLSMKWASAYYNNIRVWDIESATIEVIQGYHSKMYSETLFSLLLYYPLTIEYINGNKMDNIITTLNENFQISIETIKPMYNKDNIILYNYSSKFDWGLLNPNNFVSNMNGALIQSTQCDIGCKRCYANDITKCYECNTGYVLMFQTCKKTSLYFLKTPSKSSKSTIPFVTSAKDGDFTSLTSFTFTFWMKFYGVDASSLSSEPVILSLSSNTYLSYNKNNRHLIFSQNNKSAFKDINFHSYIGKWIPIAIANYISKSNSDIYPNMLTFSVNRIDIAFQLGYTIPSQGVPVTQIDFGYEVVALFADLRIYNKFFQGGYGKIMSQTDTKAKDLFYHKELTGSSNDNCVSVNTDLTTTVNIECVEDYSIYFDTALVCGNDNTFFSPIPAPPDVRTCPNCNAECTTLCFDDSDKTCTCDMTEGIYWLRRTNDQLQQTYCEKIPYLDFSNIYEIKLEDVPPTKTMEFSIELWAFIYSYNKSPNNFKNIAIEWDKHNKIYIFNDNSALKIKCYPLFDSTNEKLYTDNKVQSISFYKWNYIRCGTNLLTKQYYLGTTQSTLDTKEAYPDYDALTQSIFKIFRSNDTHTNFGYIFLRDIKVWQQYNYIYIDTQYLTLKDFDKFPGLLRYFKNLYKDINSQLLFIDEITKTETKVVRKIDYVGYNIVDPNNEGITSLLTLCELGEIFDTNTQVCQPQKVPQCEFIGDILNKCVTCKNQIKFLHLIDGGCYDKCPPHYFNNQHINQCRPCHDTCYRCTDRFYNNCNECTGSLYLYEDQMTCIPNCEAVGLTKSLTRPNICVTFDADASLVNVDALTPIDINALTYIEAVVIGATSTGYLTEWRFEVDETNKINQELGFTDTLAADATPFIGDVSDLNTPLDNTFFKLEHKYVISLDIIKENMGERVIVTKSWTLTMNSPPKNGYIKIIPPIGLLATTTYVITAYDWEDENTTPVNLEYYFYYIEKNTNTKLPLSNAFSTNNEVYSNFTVRFYQLESTQIDIYCIIRDRYGAETEVYSTMTVVNQIGSSLYDLAQVLSNYDLNPGIPDLKYLARSEFLKSVGINPYREVQPKQYYTTYENSLDGSIVTKIDPNCVDGYCNSNGECGLIDATIACYCDLGFVGNNCNIDKNGYSKLAYYYQEMFDRLMDVLTGTNTINQILFDSMYNIFFAAQTFIQDTTFFTVNLPKYIKFLMDYGTPLIVTQIDKLMDFYDFYNRFYYIRMTQTKLSNKISSNSPERNFTLLQSQQKDYETAYTNFVSYMNTVTKYLITNYKADYTFKTDRIHYYLLKIDETFNETDFFSTFPDNYHPYIEFMSCLTEKKSSFSYWFLYLHYLQYPFSYDSVLYPNLTSPYITVQLYDYSGNEVSITKCDNTPIMLYFPFNSYNYLTYINSQKELFDPINYKSPDDPIFRDPIYIYPNGFISDDTVQERIVKYYRHYNFSGLYYMSTSKSFSPSGITYVTYTSDKNYIVFTSEHLASFTSMLIPNNVEFVVDGRFFYIKKYMIFKYWPNYKTNVAFIIIASILLLFLFSCLFYWIYDYSYFSQKSLLEFLKREIVKVHMPYLLQNNVNVNELIPKYTASLDKKKEIKHMFDDVDFNDDSKSHDDPINLSGSEGNNNLKLNDNDFENDGGYNNDNMSDFHSKYGSDAPTEKNHDMLPITKYTDTVDNLSTVMNKYQTTTSGGKQRKKNNYFLDIDKTRPNFISLQKFHNSSPVIALNSLPEDLGNEDEDKAKTIEAYTNLNISTGSFISWNILNRHLLVNPILHRSLFNPRWKKFFALTTQLYLNMALISVILTQREGINLSNIGGMVKTALLTAFATDIIMYILVFFFITSNYQRRRLFHLVIHGEQLSVIKGFERIQKNNCCWTTIGVILCLIFWLANFYISISFTAVWSDQANTWLVTFILSVVLELLVFELIVEVIVGFFFGFRRKSECIRGFGEWLNRVRCYRTLWP